MRQEALYHISISFLLAKQFSNERHLNKFIQPQPPESLGGPRDSRERGVSQLMDLSLICPGEDRHSHLIGLVQESMRNVHEFSL